MTDNAILQGIIIGVSVVLISGLILGLLKWIKNAPQAQLERREQIRHLAQTIEQAREDIYGATDLDFTDHPIGRVIPRDELRKARLQALYQQLQEILVGRASRLKFDEIQEIKKAFKILEDFPNWIPNDQGYDGIFDTLASVEWLGLSPRG